MKALFNKSLSIFILCLFIHPVFAQEKDTTRIGSISGLVRDSINNTIIQSATVSIYKASDSSLVSYTLTTNFGEFSLKNLPYDTHLFLSVSANGYESVSRRLSIPKTSLKLSLSTINLIKEISDKVIELKGIEVRAIAPVRVRGDTIEFNADAFKLDPNAVIDDMMRQLPGITIWSDGEITINGRKVNQVLVEGKPFFGGDPKIALQNLPKNSVEKIQFYNSRDEKNQSDSLSTLNIILKENKKIGSFGKLSAGLGTNKRNSFGFMFSAFTPRSQLGTVGSMNNINNLATNTSILMNYNLFKPAGVEIDYNPDFNSPGITDSKSLGIILQHDLIKNPTSILNNRINADYFLTKTNQDIESNLIRTDLLNSSLLRQEMTSSKENYQLKHDFGTSYNNRDSKLEYYFNPKITYAKGNENTYNTTNVSNSLDGFISGSTNRNDDSFSNQMIALKAGFKTLNQTNRRLRGIAFEYVFENESVDRDRMIISDLTTAEQIDRKQFIDRKYGTHSSNTSNQFSFELNKLNELILNKERLFGITFGLVNRIRIDKNSQSDNVSDFNIQEQRYKANDYLTNSYKVSIVNYFPSLDFYKSKVIEFSDRYKKALNLKVSMGAQIVSQKSRSEAILQNFDRKYNDFIPQAYLSFVYQKFGTFERRLTVQYVTQSVIPQLHQLTPLVDSSDVYLIRLGNNQLRQQYEHTVITKFSNRSERAKKSNYFYELSLAAGIIKNKIGDSINYDEIGRRIVYPVNLNGYKFMNANFLIQHAVKLSGNKNIQFNFSSNARLSSNPSYINQRLNYLENLMTSSNLNIYYEFNSFAISLTSNYFSFRSKQGNESILLKNKTWENSIGARYNFTKSLSLTSNINFKRNINNMAPNENLLIWNIVGTYRFLPKNNGEIKFSVLDLLRQNKNLVNYNMDNSVISGSTSVLRNYYMLTFSYYPRFFGKN